MPTDQVRPLLEVKAGAQLSAIPRSNCHNLGVRNLKKDRNN
jgi:hypothetical protein